MARDPNWQSQLSELIENKRNEPFNFPTWNCLIWACAAVKAVNGLDIHGKHDGKYKTPEGAAKLMRKSEQVESSQAMLEKYLGELKPIAFARHGDIVLAEKEVTDLGLPADTALFGSVPGVCYGSVSFFVGEFGLVTVPTLQLGHCLWVS